MLARLVAALLFALCGGLAAAQTPAEPPAPAGSPAFAMPSTRAGTVMTRVLAFLKDPAGAELGEDAFSDGFKEQVPYPQIVELTKAMSAEHGAFTPVKVDQQSGERALAVRAATEKTGQTWQILLNIDENDRIEGLLLRPAPAESKPLADWAEFDTRAGALPGRISFAAYEVQPPPADAEAADTAPVLTPVHALNPDTRLAIGSTFKLYVLGALATAVQQGAAKWDEKLAISDARKSLPSGTLHNAPIGTEHPLSHYADQMISISDNTATDHLIHRVGREQVEAYMSALHGAPALNKPFLTTREMFALKLSGDSTLQGRWIRADEAIRRDMLLPDDKERPTRMLGATHTPGEVANTIPQLTAATEWTKPRHIDTIEWFASASEIARVLADLHRLEQRPGMEPLGHALRINPGLPLDKSRWTAIAFKGGSEPGVMNLSWLLTRSDGKRFIVTLGWNDVAAALDESKALDLATGAIGLLAK